MSRSVNKVILVANAGRDPETRYLPSGAAVTNLSVATNETWKDKESGERQERVEWHRLVFFGRLAEVAGQYLRKGSQVYVEGKLQTRKWQDKNTGQDRYSTEIVVSEMVMLGGETGGGNAAANNQQSRSNSAGQGRSSGPRQNWNQGSQGSGGKQSWNQSQDKGQKELATAGFDDDDEFDDSIPF